MKLIKSVFRVIALKDGFDGVSGSFSLFLVILLLVTGIEAYTTSHFYFSLMSNKYFMSISSKSNVIKELYDYKLSWSTNSFLFMVFITNIISIIIYYIIYAIKNVGETNERFFRSLNVLLLSKFFLKTLIPSIVLYIALFTKLHIIAIIGIITSIWMLAVNIFVIKYLYKLSALGSFFLYIFINTIFVLLIFIF